ncbi:MAG: SpoIIE family protein phosphatase [Bacteroidales bacterium]|nr:SpoIIE family protein phosphatase [Bacteroidales bacterium]
MSIKIMSVDDEPDMEMLIRQKFRKQVREKEYEFIFAINGLEALTKLIENPDVTLILSDINMPEMDGLTLLTKINELKNPTLRTVIVSAYGDMENIRTAMNRGAYDFATKPIDFEDLEITIKKAIKEIEISQKALKEHDQLVSIQNDLEIARDIQQSIIPRQFPPFPGRTDFELYASMNAAKSVGGDFYDFFLIDEDNLGIVMADVSDKGIPAAIYMAVSRTIIHASAIKEMEPQECLYFSNNLLAKDNENSMFVTVFYGILNIKTGVMKYSNAGHNPPYILEKDGGIKLIEPTHDKVLGIIEDCKFKTKSINLNPGDGLFLFTDGVTEAMSPKFELYTEEKLEGLLAEIKEKRPEEIIDTVYKSVVAHANGALQSDDITMLAFRYHG